VEFADDKIEASEDTTIAARQAATDGRLPQLVEFCLETNQSGLFERPLTNDTRELTTIMWPS
jgi:hypothetical protein